MGISHGTTILAGVATLALVGCSPSRTDDGEISERASAAIVGTIFGEAMYAWSSDSDTFEGMLEVCSYLQMFGEDTVEMLAEPHRTAAAIASEQCSEWTIAWFEDQDEDGKAETKVVLPMTLWICAHGSDELKQSVAVCQDRRQLANLEAVWRDLLPTETMPNASPDSVSSKIGALVEKQVELAE